MLSERHSATYLTRKGKPRPHARPENTFPGGERNQNRETIIRTPCREWTVTVWPLWSFYCRATARVSSRSRKRVNKSVRIVKKLKMLQNHNDEMAGSFPIVCVTLTVARSHSKALKCWNKNPSCTSHVSWRRFTNHRRLHHFLSASEN